MTIPYVAGSVDRIPGASGYADVLLISDGANVASSIRIIGQLHENGVDLIVDGLGTIREGDKIEVEIRKAGSGTV